MIFSNRGQLQTPVTLSDLMDAAAKLKEICGPQPTDDQKKWAVENGFIEWRGIKVSIAVHEWLKANSTMGAGISLARFNDRPLIIDGSLLPGEWLPCEVAWKKAHAH